MSQMVDTHSHLKTFLRLPAHSSRKDTSIIDEYIYLLADISYILTERFNWFFVS